MRRLERGFQRLIEKFPDFADAHGMLGGIQSMLGKHAEAIPSLERGLRSSMNTAGVYRHLTVSLAALGRYEDALRAADEGVNRNRALTSDPYFMIALATADTGLGKLEESEMALKVILAKKPDVRGDPEFKKAVAFLMAKKAERGKVGGAQR
jgi:tetratricopeptide (TPR) repeat protein